MGTVVRRGGDCGEGVRIWYRLGRNMKISNHSLRFVRKQLKNKSVILYTGVLFTSFSFRDEKN